MPAGMQMPPGWPPIKRSGVVVLATQTTRRLIVVHNHDQVASLLGGYVMTEADRDRLTATARDLLIGTNEPTIEFPPGTFVDKFIQQTARLGNMGFGAVPDYGDRNLVVALDVDQTATTRYIIFMVMRHRHLFGVLVFSKADARRLIEVNDGDNKAVAVGSTVVQHSRLPEMSAQPMQWFEGVAAGYLYPIVSQD